MKEKNITQKKNISLTAFTVQSNGIKQLIKKGYWKRLIIVVKTLIILIIIKEIIIKKSLIIMINFYAM